MCVHVCCLPPMSLIEQQLKPAASHLHVGSCCGGILYGHPKLCVVTRYSTTAVMTHCVPCRIA